MSLCTTTNVIPQLTNTAVVVSEGPENIQELWTLDFLHDVVSLTLTSGKCQSRSLQLCHQDLVKMQIGCHPCKVQIEVIISRYVKFVTIRLQIGACFVHMFTLLILTF